MITFSRFKLEEHPNCSHDFLQIHDGYNPTSRRIGRYCGSELPNGGVVNTTHFIASLFFHADASVSRDGFALSWVSIDPGLFYRATHSSAVYRPSCRNSVRPYIRLSVTRVLRNNNNIIIIIQKFITRT